MENLNNNGIKCPFCNSYNIKLLRTIIDYRIYECSDCNKEFQIEISIENKKEFNG